MNQNNFQSHENLIRKSLSKVDFDKSTIDKILTLVNNSSNEELVDQACKANDAVKIILSIAIVLASKLKNKDQNLSQLLSFLESKISTMDHESLGMYLHIKGYVNYKWKNSVYPAIKFLNQSLENLRKANNETAEFYLARVYDTFGQMAYLGGHYSEAQADYEEALKIRDHFADNFGKALTYGNLGRLHMETGNFEAAYEFFNKDLEIIKTNFPELTRIQGQLLSHLGSCMIKQKKWKAAKSLYNQSQSLAQINNDLIGQFFSFIGLGHIARLENDISSANEYCSTAETILNSSFNEVQKDAFLGVLGNLQGTILAAQKQYSEALLIFEKTLFQYKNSGHPSAVETAQLLIHYAEVAKQLEKKDLVYSLLKEALQYLDATSAIEMRQTVELELKFYHKQSWLEHFIKRFTGLENPEFLLEEAGNVGFRGEKCSVAILVSDIRDFTGISEALDPTQLISFVNEYFERMIRCVENYQGYMDKIIGDALLSVFTLPKQEQSDPDRAVYSALFMKETLKKFNDRLPEGMPILKIGLGIHFGKVVAGLIGSPTKRSYTVLGDTVNTTFRIEEMTKTLGVPLLVTKSLLDNLSDVNKFYVRPLGRICPRGRKEYVEVFEMIGEKKHVINVSKLEKEIEQTTRGLNFFYNRAFKKALPIFEELYNLTGINAYQILRDQTFSYSQTPPSKEWKGEITLKMKK